MNLFTRKCFYEKTSKMPENLDTLLQLSTSGEEVVWFHGENGRSFAAVGKFVVSLTDPAKCPLLNVSG